MQVHSKMHKVALLQVVYYLSVKIVHPIHDVKDWVQSILDSEKLGSHENHNMVDITQICSPVTQMHCLSIKW